MHAHRFFHADRNRSLVEHQDLILDQSGLSRFGAAYWPAITAKPESEFTDSEFREHHLERIRQQIPAFSVHASRLESLFAALSIEEAIQFAHIVKPVPNYDIPIFEVFSDRFRTFDMNWLDYKADGDRRFEHYKSYWYCEISNHSPAEGERLLPRLEVQIPLPAKVGKIVAWARSRP